MLFKKRKKKRFQINSYFHGWFLQICFFASIFCAVEIQFQFIYGNATELPNKIIEIGCAVRMLLVMGKVLIKTGKKRLKCIHARPSVQYFSVFCYWIMILCSLYWKFYGKFHLFWITVCVVPFCCHCSAHSSGNKNNRRKQ